LAWKRGTQYTHNSLGKEVWTTTLSTLDTNLALLQPFKNIFPLHVHVHVNNPEFKTL
jgi:hypothetical protein